MAGEAALECSSAAGGWRALPLPFALRAVAARASGGAYALGAGGELLRVGSHGRITGVFASDLVSLTTTRDHVCGIDARGDLLCTRDHHHDRGCPGVAMPAWQLLSPVSMPVSQLRSEHTQDLVCARTASGLEQCAPLRARCDRFCLSYPACAPLRCVDPCPNGEDG